MVRECLEEMLVTVEPVEQLAIQHVVHEDEGIVVLPYRARLVAGQPAAGDEVQDVGWFGPDRLPPLAFTTHRRILQHWSREVLARGAA